MWVPVQENDQRSRRRWMEWWGRAGGGIGANKFLTNGAISTFSFTQRGEDLSPRLKVHWLTTLLPQPQAFPFQTMSCHIASFFFFFFHHIHEGSAMLVPSGRLTGLTHRRVWNLWLDDGREKKWHGGWRCTLFLSFFFKIYMSQHLLCSDAPSTINPEWGVKSCVTPIWSVSVCWRQSGSVTGPEAGQPQWKCPS